MAIALNHGNGVAAAFQGGVAPVADQSVKPPVQQVLGPDPLADAAHAIETLDREETAFSNMHSLLLDQAMNWFLIGGTLSRMKENGWFAGHVSFGEMTWNEFGFKKSKAYHLINIHKTLLDAGLSWTEVEGLGWPKLRLICTEAVSAKLGHGQFSKILETAKRLKYVELEASLKADRPPVAQPRTAALDRVRDAAPPPDVSRPLAPAEPDSPVSTPDTGEMDYVWPSMEQHFIHLLDKYGGDRDEALNEIVPAFEAIFPNAVVMVEIPDEAVG